MDAPVCEIGIDEFFLFLSEAVDEIVSREKETRFRG